MRIERANAKINLYLDVVGKRENGYHDIVSIMQTVSLCDLVTLEWHEAVATTISLTASGNSNMPVDCRNLAWRAAEKFLTAAGLHGAVSIAIEKHIPMAAGLAGGSSDAAAVLRGLNALCGNCLTVQELCAVGASLGADIPFCIVGGGALVEGIGERLTEVDPMPRCALVVACRGEGVSTPWAYGELDKKYHDFAGSHTDGSRAQALLQSVRSNGMEGACKDFFNLFEEVVPSVQPHVGQLKETMQAHGALRAMMSGSGPSVFGVFPTLETAQSACEALVADGAAAFVCHPTAKYPV